MLRVRDAMTRDVFRVSSSQELLDVGDLMHWKHIRHVPVVDPEDGLVGLISHRDLLFGVITAMLKSASGDAAGSLLRQISVADVMVRDVQTAKPSDPLRQAAGRMHMTGIGCLPVVEGRRLVGIVTEADMMRVMELALFQADAEEPGRSAALRSPQEPSA